VLVRRCVQLHGGMINLSSTVGLGTTITVTLPVFGEPENPSSTPPL
jgi:signal transduction histidine kinase